jgi:predicted dehydrogenase
MEDIAQGTLVYPNNRVAAFFVSWLDPQKKREITVVGDRKMLIFDDMKPERPIKIFDKGITVSKPSEYSDTFNNFRMSIRDGACVEPDVTTGEPLTNECIHFIDCILSGSTPKTDGQNGLDVVKVLEALTRSFHEDGRPVSLRQHDSSRQGISGHPNS